MELIIVTGLSGSGKSRAVSALEDIGFYCIDNMPPSLIVNFAEISMQSQDKLERVAIVTDMRGGGMFHGVYDALKNLKKNRRRLPHSLSGIQRRGAYSPL